MRGSACARLTSSSCASALSYAPVCFGCWSKGLIAFITNLRPFYTQPLKNTICLYYAKGEPNHIYATLLVQWLDVVVLHIEHVYGITGVGCGLRLLGGGRSALAARLGLEALGPLVHLGGSRTGAVTGSVLLLAKR